MTHPTDRPEPVVIRTRPRVRLVERVLSAAVGVGVAVVGVLHGGVARDISVGIDVFVIAVNVPASLVRNIGQEDPEEREYLVSILKGNKSRSRK